ncbi:MAG TPA: non-homologous end-joining DNA ligase, partial [Candidatus Nitrosotenuis sp.]|nr:non-homologous end-joining DNA ligase [Candidatus Nitrosotenuis sp.]
MSLQEYEGKRRFQETPEPPPTVPAEAGRRFCVQRHHARHLHYDFRLEAEGVLKSWAVPRGPSMVAGEKRLAVQVEDHPVDYLFFEGVIPPGNYGAGTVMVWDLGTYEVLGDGDFAEQMRRGDLKLRLHGSKLRGDFALVHTRRPDDKGWLLIKKKDEFARPGWDIEDYAVSALTGRTQAEIGESPRPESGGADPTGGDGPRPPQARARGGPVKMPPQARRAPFPRSIRPMLARVGQPFSHPDWFFELKWDGIRALACGEEGQLRLVSRLGHSLSRSFPELLALPRRVRGQSFILDGEIVTLNAEGVPDFHRLQHRIHAQSPRSVAALTRSAPATYYLFDLLYLDGYDLREVPLEERRRLLYEILETDATFRISEAVEEQGEALFRAVQERGLEGVMAKHRHSPYEEKRSPYWLKIKAVRSTDCVIGGMTRPKGGRQHFGSLVLGQWEGDRLVHVGSVGSGFSQRQLAEVAEELRPLETSRCPFDPPPRLDDPIRCWVRPERVCEVKYSSWTPERLLRFPVFL